MKKYNCFEELKEQFSPHFKFMCEGETFEMIAQCFERTQIDTVLLENTRKGITIKLPCSRYHCIVYYYKSV